MPPGQLAGQTCLDETKWNVESKRNAAAIDRILVV